MKSPVTIRVPIEPDWDAGVALQVYTDRGTGTIDDSAPLLPRGKEVFPGARPAAGYGHQPYGAGQFGGGRAARPRNGGYGHGVFGHTPHGTSPPHASVTVHVPAAFGKWKFAVLSADGLGNVQGDPLNELECMMSATDPPTVRSLGFEAYDSQADQVSLAFASNTE